MFSVVYEMYSKMWLHLLWVFSKATCMNAHAAQQKSQSGSERTRVSKTWIYLWTYYTHKRDVACGVTKITKSQNIEETALMVWPQPFFRAPRVDKQKRKINKNVSPIRKHVWGKKFVDNPRKYLQIIFKRTPTVQRWLYECSVLFHK